MYPVKTIACLCALLLPAIPVAAQPAEAKPVQEAVEAFLLHLGDGEFDKVAADLSPKALIVVVRQRNNDWNNSYQSGDEWVASLKGNANFLKFREPISNVTVTVDSGRLAYVRADFEVVRDGKALSHGVDQFTLVREEGGWKIAAVAYTSMPK
jgi:SnoaL-like protein